MEKMYKSKQECNILENNSFDNNTDDDLVNNGDGGTSTPSRNRNELDHFQSNTTDNYSPI